MSTETPTIGRPRAFGEEAVLDRAAEVFWRHGYEGASMTTLTSAMGINRPSLYATFGSKEQLFERAFARYRETQLAQVRAALDQPTAYAAIEAFLRSSADGLTADDHPLGCLSIQGGLACSPENARISEVLAARPGRQRSRRRRTAVSRGERRRPPTRRGPPGTGTIRDGAQRGIRRPRRLRHQP
ncbi:TetR/AcrR family transcriptional regulator [Nonomuraea ferruginea]